MLASIYTGLLATCFFGAVVGRIDRTAHHAEGIDLEVVGYAIARITRASLAGRRPLYADYKTVKEDGSYPNIQRWCESI